MGIDVPVVNYLPWFKPSDETKSGMITVRHLLNQTSGLPTVCGRQPPAAYDVEPNALELRVRSLEKVKLSQPVGEVFQYSNCNYYVAGLIVEVVSKQSYDSYIEMNVLAPLEMNGSSVGVDNLVSNKLTQGYRRWFGISQPYDGDYPRSNAPSCCVISSAKDMSHYLIAHLNQGQYAGNVIVSEEGLEQLHYPAAQDGERDIYYAMGWRTGSVDGQNALWHSGDRGGYMSHMILFPNLEMGVVLLANTHDIVIADQLKLVTENIIRLLEGKEAKVKTSYLPIAFWSLMFFVFTIQIAGMLNSKRLLRKWNVNPASRTNGAIRKMTHFIVPAVINLGWAGYVLVRIPLVFSPISMFTSMAPDFGYLLVFSAVTALCWAFVRLILFYRLFYREKYS